MVYVLVGNSKTFHAYSTNQISPCHNFVFCFKNIFDFNNPPFFSDPDKQGNNQTRLRSCNILKKFIYYKLLSLY